MATILDVGIFSYFQVIFPFLLIYAAVLGLLTWTKFLGENKAIHNIIAIVIAFLFVISDPMVQIINNMVPWMTLIFLLLLFLLIAYKLMGAKDSDIAHVLTRDRTIVVWILIIFLVIFLGSVSKFYFSDQGTTTTTTEDGEAKISVGEEEIGGTGVSAFWATFVNPKVLGMIIIMLIAVFAIMMLSG